jgi:hypothetical protein
MASVNRDDGFVSAELPCIPDVKHLKVEFSEPICVFGCDTELSIVSKETQKPILEVFGAIDEGVAMTEHLQIREEESARRPVSSGSTLPQRLLVPAIIMPDKGIVYAPISGKRSIDRVWHLGVESAMMVSTYRKVDTYDRARHRVIEAAGDWPQA